MSLLHHAIWHDEEVSLLGSHSGEQVQIENQTWMHFCCSIQHLDIKSPQKLQQGFGKNFIFSYNWVSGSFGFHNAYFAQICPVHHLLFTFNKLLKKQFQILVNGQIGFMKLTPGV